MLYLQALTLATATLFMLIDLESKAIEDISSSPILQQSCYWGHLKYLQGWKPKAFDFEIDLSTESSELAGGKFQDDLLVVTREVGDGAHIAYVPYGPKNLPDQERRGHILEELSEQLRSYLSPDCILIRYDLPWNSPWVEERDCYDEQGLWQGPPEIRVREFRMNYGTKEWNLRKAPSDILPSSTLFIDLKNPLETIQAQMKPKTRYNIRLADRKGVTVREVGVEHLSIWYKLYAETAERNRITLHSIDYFKTLLKARKSLDGLDTKITMLLAEADGKALAGMFLVLSGGRGTYLYGASSNDCRNYMGTYALQWNAIKKAKEAGCFQYDMFGISQLPDPAHPMYGLYRFKSGFGGRLYHRQGCWDYPLKENLYTSFRAVEMTSQGYHVG